MPTTDERTIALCLEIADRLRAVAMDQGEDLTPSLKSCGVADTTLAASVIYVQVSGSPSKS